MRLTTKEWVEKAEGDFSSAAREMRARRAPNYDLSCFCAQQCAEKYLKGLLQESGRSAPRTHDLARLLKLIVPFSPELRLIESHLESLSAYAVEFRYPGASATKALAKRAFAECAVVREAARRILGLPTPTTRPRRRRRG
jgi:HEPN domain-containing protein